MYQIIIKNGPLSLAKISKYWNVTKDIFLFSFFLFNNFVCLSLYDSSVLCKALHKYGDSVRKINAKKK